MYITCTCEAKCINSERNWLNIVKLVIQDLFNKTRYWKGILSYDKNWVLYYSRLFQIAWMLQKEQLCKWVYMFGFFLFNYEIWKFVSRSGFRYLLSYNVRFCDFMYGDWKTIPYPLPYVQCSRVSVVNIECYASRIEEFWASNNYTLRIIALFGIIAAKHTWDTTFLHYRWPQPRWLYWNRLFNVWGSIYMGWFN